MAETTEAQQTLWSGLDLRSGIKGGSQAARELLRNSVWQNELEGGERYELLALASRTRPAAFLSAIDLPGGVAPQLRWRGDLAVAWSLRYRRVAETAPRTAPPFAIYVLGVNPPAGLTDEEMVEFDGFYTSVHMPEVAERRNCLRATRYELEQALHPAGRGSPRFLVVYEVDEAGSQNRKHIGAPYTAGPPVWQRHTTPWRFWYRRLGDD
ncbi:MAG TPA: hypothetical protein VNF07_02115 [Acidimicrobiales bacterium]|nr:hypothetical protein [Acidimicrobiales bacterium]